MKYIAKGWESYRDMVLPKDAPDIQLTECKQSFFAGAAILWESVMQGLDSGDDATEGDMQRMADIQAEIDAFGQEIDAFGQEIDKRAFGSTEH